MSSKHIHYLMIALLVLLGASVVATAIIGNSMLEQRTNKLIGLKLDSKVLDEQQTALVQANKDIIKYADLEKIAKTIVPQEKDQARAVRQIVSYAQEANIPIQKISFPTSTLGQAQPKASADTNSKVAPSTQLKAVDGLPGVYQMEITVQSDTGKPVSFSQLVDFLTKLENNRRTAQVSTISVTPDPRSRKLVTFSLAVNVYVKP
ncbi:hypothetical protein HY218_01375 [Candidatus Saccharibacteria bacterium]|nr:hypothetical protein [Candidatus Saccharibacteria bacterium]